MKYMLLIVVFALPIGAQTLQPRNTAAGKTLGWVPGSTDQLRLPPNAWYAIGPWERGAWNETTLNIRFDISSRDPLMIGVVPLAAWNYVVQSYQIQRLTYLCLKEGVVKTSFICENLLAFDAPFVVILHDPRTVDKAGIKSMFLGGVGAWMQDKELVKMAAGSTGNDVTITRYSWACTLNCDVPDPPVYRWRDLVKDKSSISRGIKSYGPFTPDRDGDTMRVKLNFPVPVTFAVVTPDLANAIREDPRRLNQSLGKTKCKGSSVQKLETSCSFSLADGPQEIVLLADAGTEIPANKKGSITVSSPQCVSNCAAQK